MIGPMTDEQRKQRDEDEANVFACYLLMPVKMFNAEYDIAMREHWEKPVSYLAQKFQVPEYAVMFRIRLKYDE